jgi:DNA adenine methylase
LTNNSEIASIQARRGITIRKPVKPVTENQHRQNASDGSREVSSAPLLKWAGGKRWLAPHLAEMISRTTFGRYFEPFGGGAALFFQLAPTRAVLSDRNADLINCYKQIKTDPESVIATLRRFRNSESDYYAIRDMRPRLARTRAARVLYLTTLAFNGIYRVNLRGEFNVPYGYKTHLKPCDAERIRAASRSFRKARLLVGDFEDVVAEADTGDLIYFDPPYTVAHGNNGFIKYNEVILQWEDQLRLARVATAAAERGCKVIISNAAHPSVSKLYRDFTRERVHRASVMAASTAFRRSVSEFIFHNLF